MMKFCNLLFGFPLCHPQLLLLHDFPEWLSTISRGNTYITCGWRERRLVRGHEVREDDASVRSALLLRLNRKCTTGCRIYRATGGARCFYQEGFLKRDMQLFTQTT